jgi:DNA-binding MurR/RpiR family transcriptional regulator
MELRKLIAGTVLVAISNSGENEQTKDIKKKHSLTLLRSSYSIK